MTRAEYLAFCKKRALEYLDAGDVHNAITSMLSDLSKHEETKAVGEAMGAIGMMTIMDGNFAGARRFIEGFN